MFAVDQKSAKKIAPEKKWTQSDNKNLRLTQRYKMPASLHQVSRSIQLGFSLILI